MIRVLIVEDEGLFRDMLKISLGAIPNLKVVDAVSDGRTAIETADRLKPDVVLMDIELGSEPNGIAAGRYGILGCQLEVQPRGAGGSDDAGMHLGRRLAQQPGHAGTARQDVLVGHRLRRQVALVAENDQADELGHHQGQQQKRDHLAG